MRGRWQPGRLAAVAVAALAAAFACRAQRPQPPERFDALQAVLERSAALPCGYRIVTGYPQ